MSMFVFGGYQFIHYKFLTYQLKQNVTQLTVRKTRNQLCKELRHKKSPNDQQSFGLYENINRDNLQYIESLIQKRKSSVDHQRAKSTLDNKHSYRQGTPIEEQESEKLFDQFFKLNNSKSESDFMKEPKGQESDFLKFVEHAIDYHKQSDVKFFKPSFKREHNFEQKLKEATISNRLLASELNKYKAREVEMKNRMKLMQKEFSIQYSTLIQKCAWLEELLAKQKIDNENSLLAVKKTLEMLQTKCKCSKGVQLYDKILRDVKNQERSRQQYEWQEESKPTHLSSELSNGTQEEEEFTGYDYQFYDKNRRKSISKVQHSSISEEQQEQLVQSFVNGKNKNTKEFPKEMFLRKLHFQDPYYIKEQNTINST